MKRAIRLRGKNYRVPAVFKVGLLCAVCLLGSRAAGQQTDSLFLKNSEGKLLKAEIEGTGHTLLKVACPSFSVQHIAGEVSPETIKISYKSVKVATASDTLCWLAQNLGASRQAAAIDDDSDEAAGWYWQYSKKQGYAWDSDNAVRTPATSWITSITATSWSSASDPCTLLLGSAWRIPTKSEWENVITSEGLTSFESVYSSDLVLHAPGYIVYNTGILSGRGTNSRHWSSTSQASTTAYFIRTYSGTAPYMSYFFKEHGFPLRCVRDLPE